MKIVRVFLAVLILFSAVFTAFIGKNKIAEDSLDKTPTPYRGVIALWQIDGFEGGVGSRKQFLLKVARMYEKNNDGVLIMVTNHTFEGAKESMNNGNYPDLISFSLGLDASTFGEIYPSRKSVGGLVGDKCYATAWCRGGYVLISNPELTADIKPKVIDNLLVSQGEYTQPLAALSLENITVQSVEVKSPMDAYVKFVSGKTPYFLATQRDLHRLSNRGMQVNAAPLTAYNDLYQYVAVTASDQNKRYFAHDFLEYLLNDTVQQELSSIGMFSDFVKVSYADETLSEMQNLSSFSTLSAFINAKKLKELQEISLLSSAGDKDALNKIKNVLV